MLNRSLILPLAIGGGGFLASFLIGNVWAAALVRLVSGFVLIFVVFKAGSALTKNLANKAPSREETWSNLAMSMLYGGAAFLSVGAHQIWANLRPERHGVLVLPIDAAAIAGLIGLVLVVVARILGKSGH